VPGPGFDLVDAELFFDVSAKILEVHGRRRSRPGVGPVMIRRGKDTTRRRPDRVAAVGNFRAGPALCARRLPGANQKPLRDSSLERTVVG